ncbi:MAG: hypothetical protein ACD_42C00457G0002 [uncultured bacterium]|nr:MAG: hypothetical protein ACD_42C00457G0002 [uncultured bacterium]OGT34539.1 MAG: hypothetical protein A3C44_08275 [Gammaproteobacteria bacterium RIFCSPHIGHO2_02_FULL_39_13]OGT50600.1 MAG: hypothetical protein A3E53_03685 [Gammaproteobacteria bacterium RIFCSPHIGHO2_12_FULL_39_24]
MKKLVKTVSALAVVMGLCFASSVLAIKSESATANAAYNFIFNKTANANAVYTIKFYSGVDSNTAQITSIFAENVQESFSLAPALGVKFGYVGSVYSADHKSTTPVFYCLWTQPVGQFPTITGYNGTSNSVCQKNKPTMNGGNYSFAGYIPPSM